MAAVHVVLSIESTLARQAISQQLELDAGVLVVGDASSPGELLYLAKIKQADAVLLEVDDSMGMPGVLTHLFNELPRLLAIGVTSNGRRAIVFRQEVRTEVIDDITIPKLLSTLETADTAYWLAAKP